MEKQLQELLENEVLGPEVKTALQEAFANKLKEAETQLQESYAQRFEHERSVLVETMDRMLNDVVRKELEEFAQDRRAVAAQRVKLAKAISEARANAARQTRKHITMLEQFMTKEIQREIQEFKNDRKAIAEQREAMARELMESQEANQTTLQARIAKLESFVLQQLSEEIAEFQSDKQALVEQRVKLANEAHQKLQETRSSFINRASTVVNRTLDEVIRKELVQWRDDIKVARENNFGRRIFEAVAAEFMTSYLSEGTKVKKLSEQLREQKELLEAAQTQLSQKEKLMESQTRAVAVAQAQAQRVVALNELLSPLARDKRKIMENLLCDVRTANLKESFQRYLPTVLNNAAPAPKAVSAAPSKSVAHSGDRVSLVESQNAREEDDPDLQNILFLAGVAKAQ